MRQTYNCHAYAAEWQDLDNVINGKDSPILTMSNPEYLSDGDVYLGTATLTIELAPKDELAKAQIERLQSLLESVRAENQKRENAINDRISKLMAIGYEASV